MVSAAQENWGFAVVTLVRVAVVTHLVFRHRFRKCDCAQSASRFPFSQRRVLSGRALNTVFPRTSNQTPTDKRPTPHPREKICLCFCGSIASSETLLEPADTKR